MVHNITWYVNYTS